MPRVYLSYRSSDAAIAHAIYQRAVLTYGVSRVVVNPEVYLPQHRQMDEYILQQMKACHKAFLIIGPEWTGIDELGYVRLSPADEPVHSEVTSALAVVPEVVPVLVNGMRALPAPDELPEEFHSLYDWEPVTLRRSEDLNRLIPPPHVFHWLRYAVALEWLRLTPLQ